jgi:hypothetical protein
MNYEQLLEDYNQFADQLKSKIATQQKLLKRISGNLSAGDIRAPLRDLALLREAAADCIGTADEAAFLLDAVDLSEYLGSGEFTAQLIDFCKEKDVDIVGEDNNFEVFPYRLKVDPANADLLINGKKAPGLRPLGIAEFLEKGRNKLLAASFNAAKFANELSAAYDLSIYVAGKGKPIAKDGDIHLATIYKYLTPMGRFRKDYDAQSFAFDLARLYDSGETVTSDERKCQFGPSRDNKKAIRILDRFGNEHFLATIRFYHDPA